MQVQAAYTFSKTCLIICLCRDATDTSTYLDNHAEIKDPLLSKHSLHNTRESFDRQRSSPSVLVTDDPDTLQSISTQELTTVDIHGCSVSQTVFNGSEAKVLYSIANVQCFLGFCFSLS